MHMANQLFPIAFVPTWLSILVVSVALIAVPLGTAFVTPASQKRTALFVCIGYVLLSCMFLAMVPIISTFPFRMQFRYLLPIYPFILIGAAVAADLLLDRQQLNSRILGLIIVGLLSIAAARSTRVGVGYSGRRMSAISFMRCWHKPFG
jgi:hypothetical protein